MATMVFNPNYTPEIPIADNPANRLFSDQIISAISEWGLQKGKEVYAKKKNTEQLLEFLMREEGFHQLDNGKPEIAIQLFEMNAFIYPKSAKALQGLGEGYMETGNKKLALKYLKESLTLNPDNAFVNRLIKQLNQ
jgi:tetratricopeptide (TPR) repeat protein